MNLFDRGERGLYLEFRERTRGGQPGRRVRVSLGCIDRDEAKAKADELALEFRKQEPAKHEPITLRRLFDIYESEETTKKAPSTQAHDRRCFEMFCRAFGGNVDPVDLSVREFNRFIADRRAGRIAPVKVETRRTVGNRIIHSDLSLLSAVFNFGTRAGDGKGGVLLERNPLKGLPMPNNESPARPSLTEAQYADVRKAAASIGSWAELMVVLAHETGHRAGSVRQLR